MWICEKWDFDNVNFVKKWDFEIVNFVKNDFEIVIFVKNEILKMGIMGILWKVRFQIVNFLIHWGFLPQCVPQI